MSERKRLLPPRQRPGSRKTVVAVILLWDRTHRRCRVGRVFAAFLIARGPRRTHVKGESGDAPLTRGIGIWQATALNITMIVGAGVFAMIPLMLKRLPGPYALLAW